jgi:hypothetical protein
VERNNRLLILGERDVALERLELSGACGRVHGMSRSVAFCRERERERERDGAGGEREREAKGLRDLRQ